MANYTDGEENTNLDKKMSELFDWSDSDLPVRDALWDYFMEANNHSTDKTAELMEPFENLSDADVKSKAEDLLKK